MSHIAILLIILSAILHAIWNYLAKGGRDIIVFFWWSLLLQLLIFAPFVLYILCNSKVDPNGWYIALASGVFVFFAWLFLAYSYKYGDLSLVYPIARSAPLFVSILAVIFFKEKLSPLGVFGILAVVLGVYIIPMRSLDIKNLLKPFSHLTGKAIMFAGLSALSLSIHRLIDKVGTRFFHPLAYVWLMQFVAFILLTLYICLSERRRLIRGEWKLNRWSALATGILVMFSYSLIVFVMRFEKISYVISMRQVSIVLGVILGNVLLKEQYGLVRFIASCLIFFGVSCIGMAE
jgi:drug/metabolite transporter (DMT)-like permease